MISDPRIHRAAFDFLQKQSSDLFLVLSAAAEVIWANESAERVFGRQLAGGNFNDLLDGFGGRINIDGIGNGDSVDRMVTVADSADTRQSYYFSFLRRDEIILVFGRIDAEELERSRHEMFVLNQELNDLSRQLHKKNAELNSALAHVKTLQGILPICMHCHKIRNDKEVWDRLEAYIERQTDAQFSHSICPDCLKTHYPDIPEDDEE